MAKDWDKIITKFEGSGLSQSEFARQNKMAANSLSYHLRRRTKNPKKKHDHGFVQVGAPAIVEVEKNGVKFRAPVTIDPALLKRFLAAADND